MQYYVNPENSIDNSAWQRKGSGREVRRSSTGDMVIWPLLKNEDKNKKKRVF